jgi:hypothetical protein
MRNTVRHLEVIETVVTRDHVDDNGVFLRPPPGHGWRVLNADRQRHTTWQRRKPVLLPRRWRRKC